MVLFWDRTCILIFLSCVIIWNGQTHGSKEKKVAIEEIIRKVYNLTSQSLNNASSDGKKEILQKIRNKLIKSAEPLGSKADKYVQIIMQGLLSMANYQTHQQTGLEITPASRHVDLRSNNKDNKIKTVASKILKLADKYLKKAEQTGQDQQKLLENVKRRVLEKAKEKHDLIHNKHDEIKKYTDLITHGMEAMIENMTKNKRRMIMEFVKKNVQSSHDENVNSKEEHKRNMRLKSDSDDDFDQLEKVDHINNKTVANTNFTTSDCDVVTQQTCKEIKTLNQFKCPANGVILPLHKLCDGVKDCPDRSDEENCIKQARKRLHTAVELMSRIESFLLRHCFLRDNDLLVEQNVLLHEVLKKQIGFINRYKNEEPHAYQLRNVFSFKKTVNQVAIVINTLAVALSSSLCSQPIKTNVRKFNQFDIEDWDEITAKPTFRVSSKSCKCIKSSCADSTCPEACKRVCWHKYSFDRWTCQAVEVADGTSVPLDVVCDGKLDCYDETDEADCAPGSSQGKFEANEYFQDVLTNIYSKSNLKEYFVVKSKLLSLAESIKVLQKMVVKFKPDITKIKSHRDICYSTLISIYEDILAEGIDMEKLEDVHFFLLNVNELLMAALKRSHTGSTKIMSPNGCFCRGSRCASKQCTETCKRVCAAGPKLTKYWCKGTNNNISVPLEAVCDGKVDCPLEDDEAQCRKDICRRHHLVLLRHNIRDVGEKQKGTSLGENLLTWKNKVTSTLKVAENNYRPTPMILRDILAKLLHDLVTMYASIVESRRTNTGYVFKEFYKVSQNIIEILKSCGK